MKRISDLDVSTGYLIEGVQLAGGPTIHQIRLTVPERDPENAQLVLDPNVCGLDSFGDPTVCTRIAVRVVEVNLVLLEERDGKLLFAIESEEYTGPELHLALLPCCGMERTYFTRLLVLGDQGIQQIVNLEAEVQLDAAG